PDGTSLATLRGNRGTLVDPETGRALRQLPGPEPGECEAWSFLLSPDGRLVAYGGPGRVEVWDAVAGRRCFAHQADAKPAEPGDEPAEIRPLAFLGGAGLITVTESAGSVTTCWDLPGGARRWEHGDSRRGDDATCRAVGVAPPGDWLVAFRTRQGE